MSKLTGYTEPYTYGGRHAAAPGRVAEAPVNVTPPHVSGSPMVGSAVSVDNGIWTGTPTPTITRQWRVDGVAVDGETGVSYVLRPADLGKAVGAVLTAANTEGTVTQSSNLILVVPREEAPAVITLPVVSGNPAVGSLLTATAGTWSGIPAPALARQWRRDGVDLSGFTGGTYTTTTADVGTAITCFVTAVNAVGVAVASSNAIAVVASTSAPAVVTPPSLSGSAVAGSQLTVNRGEWSGLPAPTFTYQWRVDGVDQPSATGTSYTTDATQTGSAVTCRVTASNAAGTATATTAPVTVVSGSGTYSQARLVVLETHGGMAARVARLAFLPATGTAFTGTPTASSELSGSTVKANAFDASVGTVWSPALADPRPTLGLDFGAAQSLAKVEITYAGSHTDAWEDSLSHFLIEASNNGVDWDVVAEVRDEAVWNDGVTRSYTIGAPQAKAAPVNTAAPAVVGQPHEGSTLTCGAGQWTGNPAPSFAYQWKADGTNLAGETANTLVVPAGRVGQSLTCAVTATNSEGSATATSAAVTVTPVPSAPANTVAPSITGGTASGSTLTLNPGTWSGYPAPVLAYQWLSAGVEIAGETGTTYVTTVNDDAKAITCRVDAGNASGTATATSNAITVVAPDFAPVNVTPPSITGSGLIGTVHTANNGAWNAKPAATFTRSWKVAGIEVGTGSTYTPVAADNGKLLVLTVTATNAQGTTTAGSAAKPVVDQLTASFDFTSGADGVRLLDVEPALSQVVTSAPRPNLVYKAGGLYVDDPYGGSAVVYLNSTALGSAQKVEAMVKNMVAGRYLNLTLRLDGPGYNEALVWSATAGYAVLITRIAGVSTQIAAAETYPSFADGDRFSLEINAASTQIVLRKNGVAFMTYTPTVTIASGTRAGFGLSAIDSLAGNGIITSVIIT